MKKFFSLVLALVMALSLTTVAWGAVNDAATLQTAFTAGGDVVLDDSFTVADTEITVPADKSVVLDLNGKTLSFTGTGMIRVYGELTVNGTGTITAAGRPAIMMGQYDVAGVTAGTGAKLTVNGGTISSTSTGFAAIQGNGTAGTNSNQNTTIVITGGVITAATADGIYHPQAGSLTISGGEISGYTGIAMKSGTLTITGGKIKGTGAYVTAPASDTNGIITDGSAICVDSNVGYAGGMEVSISGNAELVSANGHIIREVGVDNEITNISVTGGTFTAAADKEAINLQDATPAAIASVSGGTFNTDVSEYVASGYTFAGDSVVLAKTVASTVEGLYAKATSQGATASAATVKSFAAVDNKVDEETGAYVADGNVAYFVINGDSAKYVKVATVAEADVVLYTDAACKNAYMYLDAINPVYFADGAVFTDFGTACGQYNIKDADYDKTATYYTTAAVPGALYVADKTSAMQLMVNGKLVAVSGPVAIDKIAHKAIVTTDKKGAVESIKCAACGVAAVKAPNYASIPAAVVAAGQIVSGPDANGAYWYWGTAAAGTIVESAQTFDAGIAMYVGMSVMAAAGSVVVFKKRED